MWSPSAQFWLTPCLLLCWQQWLWAELLSCLSAGGVREVDKVMIKGALYIHQRIRKLTIGKKIRSALTRIITPTQKFPTFIFKHVVMLKDKVAEERLKITSMIIQRCPFREFYCQYKLNYVTEIWFSTIT